MNLFIGEAMNNILPLSIAASVKVKELEKGEAEKGLATTLSLFEQWRGSKKKISEPIPDELYQHIFSLEKFYPPVQLRRFFNLSTRQYETKREKFLQDASAPSPKLCQVKIKAENPYSLESLPSAKTLVVEFCRSDGQIMKIHTTQDSIPTLMNTFLGSLKSC
jgi:hypothetical protein